MLRATTVPATWTATSRNAPPNQSAACWSFDLCSGSSSCSAANVRAATRRSTRASGLGHAPHSLPGQGSDAGDDDRGSLLVYGDAVDVGGLGLAESGESPEDGGWSWRALTDRLLV